MIFLAWAIVVASLPAAVVLFRLSASWPLVSQQRLLMSCLVVVALTVIAGYLEVSFTRAMFNMAIFGLCYVLYCYIVVSFVKVRNKLLRASLLVIASTPILGGYTLATVGLLAFMFIAGDIVEPPAKTEVVTEGVRCDTSFWGMVASDSGYKVALYKSWKFLPLLEKSALQVRLLTKHTQVITALHQTAASCWLATENPILRLCSVQPNPSFERTHSIWLRQAFISFWA